MKEISGSLVFLLHAQSHNFIIISFRPIFVKIAFVPYFFIKKTELKLGKKYKITAVDGLFPQRLLEIVYLFFITFFMRWP